MPLIKHNTLKTYKVKIKAKIMVNVKVNVK